MKTNYFEILDANHMGKVSSLTDRKGGNYYRLDDIENILGTENKDEDIRKLTEVSKTLGIDAIVNFEQGVQVLAHKDGTEMSKNKYGWFVTEIGLYFLIMQSENSAALKFSAWLAGEVLPRLREKSKYEMGEENQE